MKQSIYTLFPLLLVLLMISSCNKEKTTSGTQPFTPQASAINGTWNLIRVYGGIAGINETHSPGDVEWTFDTQAGTLTVNDNGNSSAYYDLPSGTYNFQQISSSNQHYLAIEANELGQFTISGNQLVIDENNKSDGEGACGFYMVLER